MTSQSEKPKILVVDDEEIMRNSLVFALSENYTVMAVPDGFQALEKVDKEEFDLVLLDVKMPGIDGLETFERTIEIKPELPVIMISGHANIKDAVKAMKLGAHDYITKPFSMDEINVVIEKVLQNVSLRKENQRLKQQINDQRASFDDIIGSSPAMRKVYQLIEEVAKTTTTALVQGETGTGKELVAKAIHNSGPRQDKNFVAVSCAALPESLLETTLFGYEAGAFTGANKTKFGVIEHADGGTLFLDEVGETSPALQTKLLRVLQERQVVRVGGNTPIGVNIHLIAATNRDLKREVDEGKFRDDLFYRLNVVPINVPPLRDRREDIPLLARHFLAKYNRQKRKDITGFTPEAMSALMTYPWRGNVRELQNVIERVVTLSPGDVISLQYLPAEIRDVDVKQAEGTDDLAALSLREVTKQAEKEYLEAALRKADGNVSRAAKIARIERQYFYKKMKEHGIDPGSFRGSDRG